MAGPTHPELRGARVLITGGSSGSGLVTAEPTAEAHATGGLSSRPSVLQKLRR